MGHSVVGERVLPGRSVPDLRLLPYGEAGVLAELPDLTSVLRLYRSLSRSLSGSWPHGKLSAGITDLVPAARTVLVIFDPGVTSREVIESLLVQAWERREQSELEGDRSRPGRNHSALDDFALHDPAPEIRIPVRYDGPDLATAADFLGLSAAELIEAHTASAWTAAFTGFAPGFAYLITDHQRLQVPRRVVPRTAVPAGSVALAGEFSAIYPAVSPGGWQLIGTTQVTLWDADRQQSPALIVPGTRVRFIRAGSEGEELK